jgi:hypothetical protein
MIRGAIIKGLPLVILQTITLQQLVPQTPGIPEIIKGLPLEILAMIRRIQ